MAGLDENQMWQQMLRLGETLMDLHDAGGGILNVGVM